jgi:hypothetical protein
MLVNLVHVASHQDHIEWRDLQIRHLAVAENVVDEKIALNLM